MSPFIRIPLGFAIMVVGFLMVKNTNVVISWFGRVPFAEDKFGSGGSIFFYKLLGVFVSFLGIAIATNVISGILEDLAGLLTHS
ncbi:hypothetical protein HQ487_04375 [Candidatus Uhrbacteria bacterium]|nr:hypothetical protein [Candidatus Uhrbacteria bacterium]